MYWFHGELLYPWINPNYGLPQPLCGLSVITFYSWHCSCTKLKSHCLACPNNYSQLLSWQRRLLSAIIEDQSPKVGPYSRNTFLRNFTCMPVTFSVTDFFFFVIISKWIFYTGELYYMVIDDFLLQSWWTNASGQRCMWWWRMTLRLLGSWWDLMIMSVSFTEKRKCNQIHIIRLQCITKILWTYEGNS